MRQRGGAEVGELHDEEPGGPQHGRGDGAADHRHAGRYQLAAPVRALQPQVGEVDHIPPVDGVAAARHGPLQERRAPAAHLLPPVTERGIKVERDGPVSSPAASTSAARARTATSRWLSTTYSTTT